MKISDVLRTKGGGVVTVSERTSVEMVLDELAGHRIGCVVVTHADGRIAGILSERDVVRRLPAARASIFELTAGDLMTSVVATCSPEDDVEVVMRTMTDRRVRHLPVVDDTGLIGIVSIGDVVKSRIDELQATAHHLENYIAGG